MSPKRRGDEARAGAGKGHHGRHHEHADQQEHAHQDLHRTHGIGAVVGHAERERHAGERIGQRQGHVHRKIFLLRNLARRQLAGYLHP
jgi:hypothetical protein